ncbi:copper amine oxidase [Flavisolibacter tropicus]|uniref:Copper amine oxidase n=1 Tax=Flavisolibacter tropicus TaxID=1492898 RepID=A0A172TSX0_9BACT|nr:copper amine oxidase [Flavisolibacter tropicus]ANE49984.1 copper amine oxidase [Flavisolibacter tropicus]
MKKHFKLTFFFASALALQSLSLKGQQLTSEHNKALLIAAQGSIVELPGFLTEKISSIPYQKMVLPGPQYIISDDPEYIRVPEIIALKEAVQPGAVRLYVYNVNGIQEPQKIDRKITAVIKNTGKSNMTIRMLRYSSQKPTTNYFLAGKNGLADYFASQPEMKGRTVKPGQIIAIDEKLEKQIVKYDELVHGFYEFVIDQPAEISILQTDPSTPGPKAAARIKDVASSRHTNAGRGLFGVSNYLVVTKDTFDTKNEAAAFVMADGKEDPWIMGKDASTGDMAKLAGNYGVMYNVEMKWKSTNGKGLALVTWNARAGDNKWCGGMANTMVVSDGKFKEGIIQLPADQLRTKGAPEAILVQIFPPAKNGEVQTINYTYSPPGASCLPTPLIVIPIDMQ